MLRVVHDVVQAFRYVNIAGYIALAGVALLAWRRRRDHRAGMWAALAFGSLGLLEILALIPNHPGNLPERAVGRVELALFVLFPYLLFRFTAVFRHARRDLANLLGAITTVLVVWSFALPRIPQSGEHWYPSLQAFIGLFFVHWTVLAVLVAVRLWLAGAGQPSVARKRMRLLAFASAAITVALFTAFGGSASGSALAGQILALLAVVAFYLGLAPPALVRAVWRMPEQARLQAALVSLLTFAETREEVAKRVLEPAAALVGARALAIRSGDGLVAGWNMPDEAWPALREGAAGTPSAGAALVELALPDGALLVSTSPYAPFFGEEELGLLRTLGALIGVALDRVRAYEAEHDARAALERANEVKTNFVALAAHELRTPMTTVHGFVTTLHHLSDRLEPGQRDRIRDALLQQTDRMAQLIEQLLDLSRLDAEAIEIAPEPLPLRDLLHEIVRTAAPDPEAVALDVPADLVAEVDPHAVERMVGNLVANAFRYGAPPVRVGAERNDRHLRLTVEDRGGGVDPEFVPNLFERFTRSESARAGARGTGLGLAIARLYARAHGGDLVYERAEPHGACFRIVLPAARGRALLPDADALATL